MHMAVNTRFFIAYFLRSNVSARSLIHFAIELRCLLLCNFYILAS